MLIFKIWKIRNVGFVCKLILNNSCEFYLSTINMATLPLKASRKKQHSVFHFLYAKRRCPNTIRSEMHPVKVYGNKCFTRPAIHVWCKKFACGELWTRKCCWWKNRPGQCVVSTTDPAIAAVTSLIRSDRRVSISVQINLDNMLKNKRLMFDI